MRFEDELHRLELELMATFEEEVELIEERLEFLCQRLNALIWQRNALREAHTKKLGGSFGCCVLSLSRAVPITM